MQEVLADPEITSAALRDLSLKMENPSLQDIRNACADLFRPADEASDDDVEMISSKEAPQNDVIPHPEDPRLHIKPSRGENALPDEWVPKREAG